MVHLNVWNSCLLVHMTVEGPLFLAAVHSWGHEAFTGPDGVMFHRTNDPPFLTSSTVLRATLILPNFAYRL